MSARRPLSADAVRMLESSVAKRIGAEDGQCFWNAFRAHAFVPQGRYVEGFVNGLGGHGWVETRDGNVLDVTPVYQEHAARETRAYFPVERWTRQAIIRALWRTETLPIHGNIVGCYSYTPESWPAYEAYVRQMFRDSEAAAELRAARRRKWIPT